MIRQIILGLGIVIALWSCSENEQQTWGYWQRSSDHPEFITTLGNNHDAILLVEEGKEYPYHMIVSGWDCKKLDSDSPKTFLWRAKSFGFTSESWELVDSSFAIDCQYEYDDAVVVNDTYYVYENGLVYTFSGNIDTSSTHWKQDGTFPYESCDDIGIYYEDGLFHIFGEYGSYEHSPHDGTSLSHYVSSTGVGDWQLIDNYAVTTGQGNVGVGDATIIKVEQTYYLFCDVETENAPYRIAAWKSSNINSQFEYLGIVISPREDRTQDWDNHRIQDGDIQYIPEIGKYVMVVNMMDRDGNPGGHFPYCKNYTRVIGFFETEGLEFGN